MGKSARGIPEDYDNWASWGNDEWSYLKVLPYFRKMENDLDFRGTSMVPVVLSPCAAIGVRNGCHMPSPSTRPV